MTTPNRARHRAPPPPPLLARLNESTPLRVALTVGVGLLILGSLIGIADDMGDDFTPRARAAVTALPSRAEEPTGRGGPLAPVFDDVDAPDYQPDPPYASQSPVNVHTRQGQRTAVARTPTVTTAPALPAPAAPTPDTTPSPTEPEPVVGLPVVESAQPAPPVIEEEAPVTETEPTVVVEPTATPEPTPIEETP